ncbi:hypothetical protein CGMCC3_g1989 [Colletotrichum fructicola]|nr:uncharacterized protein CGMCC3_g1989 [Colletotrichum fructicola]KAE9581722.1 hypothetical protein CGMCC3_g1989 [Colletotrichum fructicola]
MYTASFVRAVGFASQKPQLPPSAVGCVAMLCTDRHAIRL